MNREEQELTPENLFTLADYRRKLIYRDVMKRYRKIEHTWQLTMRHGNEEYHHEMKSVEPPDVLESTDKYGNSLVFHRIALDMNLHRGIYTTKMPFTREKTLCTAKTCHAAPSAGDSIFLGMRTLYGARESHANSKTDLRSQHGASYRSSVRPFENARRRLALLMRALSGISKFKSKNRRDSNE